MNKPKNKQPKQSKPAPVKPQRPATGNTDVQNAGKKKEKTWYNFTIAVWSFTLEFKFKKSQKPRNKNK